MIHIKFKRRVKYSNGYPDDGTIDLFYSKVKYVQQNTITFFDRFMELYGRELKKGKRGEIISATIMQCGY